jgi:PucR C-terminal helix-turn-helix domain/GGDEF-like domain
VRIVEKARADLSRYLRERRPEIERAIFARISAMPAAGEAEGGEYENGLQSAVVAGVGDGLVGVERGSGELDPVPAPLLAQARRAARNGVTLDVVLRRYFAGYTLFNDFVMRAAEEGPPSRGSALRPLLHVHAARFERLVTAAVGEYAHERGQRPDLPDRRQVERVKRLLAGEPVNLDELAYRFDDWHVGAVASGENAVSALRRLAEAADCRLLLVRPGRQTAWAWFGGRRRIAMVEIARRASSEACGDALIAFGETARGIEGWRLTHRQAGAALRTAQRGAAGVIRYADVALLASISQDQVLASSLHQLYLAPLADGRDDGGAGLRETLRAYFRAGRNVSSAASALGVSRQTVGNRLRAIEEKLGRTLESCAPEIELALRLELNDRSFAAPSLGSNPNERI